MLRRFFGQFLLLALAAPSLWAQQISSPFRYIETKQSLGAFAGYLVTEGGEVNLLGAPESQLGPRSAPIVGLRYTSRFSGPLSGEIALGFSPGSRSLYETDALLPTDTTQYPVESGSVNTRVLLAEGGLRFHLTGPRTWNNLAPYLVATGGLIADIAGRGEREEALPDPERFRLGPGFALGAGLGLDYFLSPRVSVRTELRDQVWRVKAPDGLPVATGEDQTRWTNNLGLSLGAAFHF